MKFGARSVDCGGQVKGRGEMIENKNMKELSGALGKWKRQWVRGA